MIARFRVVRTIKHRSEGRNGLWKSLGAMKGEGVLGDKNVLLSRGVPLLNV